MRVIVDFLCGACGTKWETLTDSQNFREACPSCGGEASRMISAVRTKLDGTDPGFPGAYDKWARNHEKAARTPTG